MMIESDTGESGETSGAIKAAARDGAHRWGACHSSGDPPTSSRQHSLLLKPSHSRKIALLLHSLYVSGSACHHHQFHTIRKP